MATNILQLDSKGEKVLIGESFNQVPSLKQFKSDQKILKYLFHVLHPGSVLQGLELTERIVRARMLLELTKEETETMEVLKALSDYESTLEADISYRTLRSVTQGVNSLTRYFANVDFDKVIQSGPQMGKLVHDPKTLISGIKDARPVLEQLEVLKTEVLESMKIEEEGRARGGVEKSAFAKLKK